MPAIDMKPLVMQYLVQMGYSSTYFAVQESPQTPRKNTMDAVLLEDMELLDTQSAEIESNYKPRLLSANTSHNL